MSDDLINWIILLVLFAISWGLARVSRAISARRELKRDSRQRRLTDFASTILYFTFLILGILLLAWTVAGPAFDAAPPPNPLAIALVVIAMIACGVVGYSLEAGKTWAIGGVWVISAFAIGAFIWSMVTTGIVQLLAVGLILLYACAIGCAIALMRTHRGPRATQASAQ